MEQVPTHILLNKHHYYLPHHCVQKSESTSTKLRVVFDGSCKTTSGKSLNDIMHIGPSIQNDLFSILLQFRLSKYAVTADISKMYRQIKISEDHSNLQCILWRNNNNEHLQTYKLNTVTYGTSAAPFLAIRSLHFLADNAKSNYPLGSNIIKTQFYVDDMLTGANTIAEAKQIIFEVNQILNAGKFTLCKWASNSPKILHNIPADKQEILIEIDEKNVIKTLGISWEPKSDMFHFRYRTKESEMGKITKRKILSEIASLFDPLGLINPIIVLAKIFMQRLWQLQVNWDESLPMEYCSQWEKFRSQLPFINNIKVPRTVIIPQTVSTEIHAFSDASLRAYGCSIYLRCIGINGEISLKLLAAKSRVAPLKTITLPRLELCAAHMQYINIFIKGVVLITNKN